MQKKTFSPFKKHVLLFTLIAISFFQFSFVSFRNEASANLIDAREKFFDATLPFSYDPLAETELSAPAVASSLYEEMDLSALGLEFRAFEYALKGLGKIIQEGIVKDNILTIADFSQPSTKKRLYVIDLEQKQVLFNTYVAHGRNSGTAMATRFSNTNSSFQSSLGFYKTANTYRGKHGYSLRLEGLEKGINHNALTRAIVMHAADYVSEQTIRSLGYLGRSLGCPAVPKELNKPIIDQIKDGSTLFIYHPSENYVSRSSLL